MSSIAAVQLELLEQEQRKDKTGDDKGECSATSSKPKDSLRWTARRSKVKEKMEYLRDQRDEDGREKRNISKLRQRAPGQDVVEKLRCEALDIIAPPKKKGKAGE
eukprot:Sspe_Gene.34564::Locus_16794_Transcript_1_2_Confidence_0.667_Length_901::g.34564::m.34564